MTTAVLAAALPRRLPLSLAPPPVEHLRWHSLDDDPWGDVVVQDELPLDDSVPHRSIAPGRRDTSFDRRSTPTAELPDAAHFASRLGIVLVEIVAGSRPATQFMRHCAPKVLDSVLRRQSHRVGRSVRRQPVRLRRTLVCHVRDGVVEATVIVADSHRVRPIALRLEGLDGRWLVTALEMG